MAAVSRSLLAVSRWPGAAYLASCGCRSFALANGDLRHPSISGRQFCSSASGETTHALRRLLLDGALKHVGELGWTDAALVAAARDLKLSPAVAGMLPRGEGELVEHFMELSNSRCIKELEARQQELQSLPLNERVTNALKVRLELVKPFVDSWPQALAVASRPSNAPHSIKLLFGLVDDVWAALGDGSTDVTWYSKRAVLAGVYTSTSLYMLTDYSPAFKDTWDALRRRVDEGLALDASLQRVVHTANTATTATGTP